MKKLFKLFDDKKMNYFVSLGAREQEVIFPCYFSSTPADIVRHYENYTRLNWRAKRQRPRHLSRRSSLSQNNYIWTKRGARVRLVAWQGVIKKRTGAETRTQPKSSALTRAIFRYKFTFRWLINVVLCPQVSWIRRTDYHLLTVGLATYSSDDRFFTAHVHNTQVKSSLITSSDH